MGCLHTVTGNLNLNHVNFHQPKRGEESIRTFDNEAVAYAMITRLLMTSGVNEKAAYDLQVKRTSYPVTIGSKSVQINFYC